MPSLERAHSVAEFLAEPLGRYFRGRRFLVFARSDDLLGFASWGRPDTEDVRELLGLCAIGLRDGMRPYRWLVDVRGLELVEPGTFALFLDYTRRHRDVLRRNIWRQAQLRPEGLVGAIISGFSHLARLSYPDRAFGDVEEAIAWLEIEREEGLTLLAELERIRDAAQSSYAIVNRLREALVLDPSAAAAETARRLGLSTRSLQRALQEAGTTYRMEVASFRMRRAQELLLETDRNHTWIAGELGFSSVQHFATAFRRAVGETPASFRARHATSRTRLEAT